MKRLLTLSLFILLLVLALPVLASEESVITLDDTTPSVHSVISLPQDTTGTVRINMSMAAVTLTDEAGNIVFHAADERIHALELNIAPNTGQHTLTIERLPNASVAYASIAGIDNLTNNGESQQVSNDTIGFNQSSLFSLDASNPNATANVSIPAEATGVITATFVGAAATTQLVDKNSTLLFGSFGGDVDGIEALVDGGDYNMNIWGTGLSQRVVSEVRVMPTDEAGFILMDVPQSPETVASRDANACTATILVSSVNLRSGPGTGYSVLQYGYYGETYPVGGSNASGGWLVIGTNDGGSAWVAANTAQLDGNCKQLTSFDIPYREAQEPQIIITTPEPQTLVIPAQPATVNNSGSSSYHDDEHEGHDEHNDD